MNGLFDGLMQTTSVAIWAMMVASVLPFIFTLMAKYLGGFTLKDNNNPRDRLDTLTGRAARAHAIQQNSFETLPVFLVSVVTAMLFFVPQVAINQLAILYVCLRIAYAVAYLLNLATWRSILWGLSIACCLTLFYLASNLSS